jgi:hypothetical protein
MTGTETRSTGALSGRLRPPDNELRAPSDGVRLGRRGGRQRSSKTSVSTRPGRTGGHAITCVSRETLFTRCSSVAAGLFMVSVAVWGSVALCLNPLRAKGNVAESGTVETYYEEVQWKRCWW